MSANMGDFKEGFITLNYVPTHIMTWGGWIEGNKSSFKEIALIFIGNPGVGMFYTEFLQQLNQKLKMPVWLISHAGHELPPGFRLMPSIDKNKHLFNVEGQINNKREFIKRYVPKNCKIHLLGHSVGAYMALQLLKEDDVADQVQGSYLLFPVLENIAETPNGRFFTKVAVKMLWLVYFLAGIFLSLPHFLKIALITGYLRLFGNGSSSIVKHSVAQLVNPKILHAVFFLAIDEMDRIKELDVETISKMKDKIFIYYGDHDRWAPVSHYERIVKAVPGVQAQVCTKGLDHAFMLLRPSHIMADVVEDLITKNRLK
ncbi:hypothetical protein ONE63_007641 [Megalurothrips usitatus]|uniref:Lipid droplet-associated hydrolase n=1 Tax=Megalurothrips usitatus TaxID=439358 RepID=A0AAV7XQT5_9NEOP|nr:hypothetical protein ONE63_007641 [Megalurothrips usitatus]